MANWWARLLSRFWVLPALCCATALVLGLVVPQIDHAIGDRRALLFGGGPNGARSLLTAITTAMISVTGVIFSITVVVLQLASSQFSPRVLRSFLASRVTQMTLGVFSGTFLYSIVVLRSVRGDAGVAAFVPQLAITGAFLSVVASVAMFLAYIHHITESIRVTTIISSVGTETREVIEKPREGVPESPTGATLTLPPANDTVHSAGHGVVTMIDVPRLIRLAHGHDVVFELLTRMGDFVAEGMPLVDIHGNAEQLDHDAVRSALRLASDRSMHDDVAFGFRQLVDIAERALSAAVNDPTTAVQVLDEIHDLLRTLAVLPDPPVVRVDHDDDVRLLLRERTFAEFLDLGIDEIAHYGAEHVQVPARIRDMLVDLKLAGRPQHQAAITAKQCAVASKQ